MRNESDATCQDLAFLTSLTPISLVTPGQYIHYLVLLLDRPHRPSINRFKPMKASTQLASRAAPRRAFHATRSVAAGKDLMFGVEGRGLMLAGVDKLADAVQVHDFRIS